MIHRLRFHLWRDIWLALGGVERESWWPWKLFQMRRCGSFWGAKKHVSRTGGLHRRAIVGDLLSSIDRPLEPNCNLHSSSQLFFNCYVVPSLINQRQSTSIITASFTCRCSSYLAMEADAGTWQWQKMQLIRVIMAPPAPTNSTIAGLLSLLSERKRQLLRDIQDRMMFNCPTGQHMHD